MLLQGGLLSCAARIAGSWSTGLNMNCLTTAGAARAVRPARSAQNARIPAGRAGRAGKHIWADGEAADLADFEAIRFLLRDALFIVPVSVEGTPAEAWCISQTYLATKTGRHGDRREPFLGLFRLAMEYLGVDVHYGQSGRSGWQDM